MLLITQLLSANSLT